MSHHFSTSADGQTHLTIEPGTPNETTFSTHQVDLESFFSTARLGGYLQQLRRQGNFNLRQVSQATGVSTAYLSLIETDGRKSPPGVKILQALATFYGVSLQSLLLVGGLQPLPTESTPAGDTQLDLNIAFKQLTQHPALQTAQLKPEHLRWLSPDVKRAWLAFAQQLYDATRSDNPQVHTLMADLAQSDAFL